MQQTKLIQLQNLVLENIKTCYDTKQRELANLALHSKTEGEIRHAAGNLVEDILQSIFNTINSEYPDFNIDSKVGSSDYLSEKILYKGIEVPLDKIQVDRHVWSDGNRIAFIENKTYLDSCYYARALSDFRKIAQALLQQGIDPAGVEYIVFAGQNAASDNTLLANEALFFRDTSFWTNNKQGIEPKIYFFLKGKRSSSKPLYRIKHELNEHAIKEFVSFIVNSIEVRHKHE